MKFVALNVIAHNYDKFLNKKLDFDEPHLIEMSATYSTAQPYYSVSRNSL
jgi:hypothetical protein